MDSPLNIYMYAVALTYSSVRLCTPARIGMLRDTTAPIIWAQATQLYRYSAPCST